MLAHSSAVGSLGLRFCFHVISTEPCDERSNQAAFGNMDGYVRNP
jgi:hypothetical protein